MRLPTTLGTRPPDDPIFEEARNLYADGSGGVAQSGTEAVAWHLKALKGGGPVNPYSRYGLGSMYANGRGMAQSEAEVVAWFREAAERGDAKPGSGWV